MEINVHHNSFVRGLAPNQVLGIGIAKILKKGLIKLIQADINSSRRILQIKIHSPWGMPIATITGHRFHTSSNHEYINKLIRDNDISKYIPDHVFQTSLNENGRFEFHYLIKNDYRKKGFSIIISRDYDDNITTLSAE